jgi:hypothetical protein
MSAACDAARADISVLHAVIVVFPFVAPISSNRHRRFIASLSAAGFSIRGTP